MLNVPAGRWHSLKSLESGMVLFEAKEGKWEPLGGGGDGGCASIISTFEAYGL